jgi:carbonic anhydrase
MRIRLRTSLKWTVLVVMLFSWAQVALSMEPNEAMQMLKAGNARFVAQSSLYPSCGCTYPDTCSEATNRDRECKLTTPNDLACLKSGQNPFATIVSCSDSRIVPETIFDTGFEDLFVIRVAGNTYDDVALGSMEYGVEHAHTPVLVILGHQHCGAVTATVNSLLSFSEEGGYIRSILNRIFFPVVQALIEYKWPTTNEETNELIGRAIKKNVEYVKEVVIDRSETVRELIDKGELRVVGAIAYMEGVPGQVTINPGEVVFDDDPRW